MVNAVRYSTQVTESIRVERIVYLGIRGYAGYP